MNKVNLNSFLKMGYFLNYCNPNYEIDLNTVDKSQYIQMGEDELVNIGVIKLKNSIKAEFKNNKKHVIPLSGGLDSRAILATLLEYTEVKNINTYTFGTPGSYDYEIGSMISKKIGTKHTYFPLNKYKYNMEELIDISKKFDNQTMLFHHGPIWKIVNKFKDFSLWSGCMGDIFTGTHLVNTINDLQEAKEQFLLNESFVKTINLIDCNEKEFLKLISFEKSDKSLNIYEQLHIQNTGLKSELPHVVFKGLNFKVPYLNKDWVKYILSVDDKYRKNRYIYKKILLKAFPNLFKLPTKNNFGLPLDTSPNSILIKRAIRKIRKTINKFTPIYFDPDINYLAFDEAIRNKIDLKNIVYENIMDLKQRKIVDWIDIDNIWKRHINKKANHADALIVLASLEIHLKAGKNI